MKTSNPPIILHFDYEHSAMVLWKAITNLGEMKLWYFENIPDFIPQVGFETEFFVESEDRKFTHQWTVTEVELNKLISYSWQYTEYSGRSDVWFEIKEIGEQSTLKLTVKVLKDFPDDIPEFQRQSCIDGWNYFLEGRLRTYLDSQ